MSDVSLARLSWEMMGAHVLIGIHSLSIGQEEIESKIYLNDKRPRPIVGRYEVGIGIGKHFHFYYISMQ